MKTRRWSINADELLTCYKKENKCIEQPLPGKLGIGRSNIFQLDKDIKFIETFYTPSRDLVIFSQMDIPEPRLVVTLGLKGHSRYIGSQGEEIVFKEGHTTITSFNSSLGERHYQADESLVQLRFSVSKKWLDRYFGGNQFHSFFKKNSIQTLSYRPISTPGLIAAQQLLNGNVPDNVRQVFVHGQVLLILASELSHLMSENNMEKKRFAEKDRPKANAAKEILLAEFRKPPSVGELARRVGTNQLKLKQLFHSFFNTTPYCMLLEIRMNKAYKLLKSTHCQVSAAADFVGYSHASNFSTAFVKYFGVSPKQIAKMK